MRARNHTNTIWLQGQANGGQLQRHCARSKNRLFCYSYFFIYLRIVILVSARAVSNVEFNLSEIIEESVSGTKYYAGVSFIIGKLDEFNSKLTPAQLKSVVDELFDDIFGGEPNED